MQPLSLVTGKGVQRDALEELGIAAVEAPDGLDDGGVADQIDDGGRRPVLHRVAGIVAGVAPLESLVVQSPRAVRGLAGAVAGVPVKVLEQGRHLLS